MVRSLYILIAVLYPVAAVAAFAFTVRTDNFAIFDTAYQAPWLLFIPAALILATIGLAFTGRALGRLWRLALIAWIALVTWGHDSLIRIAAGSV